MFLLIISIVTGIECQKEQDITEIPCQVTSTWVYPNCSTESVSIYNTTAKIDDIQLNTTPNGLCDFVFVYDEIGSYYYNTSRDDTGSIEVKNMNDIYLFLLMVPISLMILFAYLSFQLNKRFIFLKWSFLLLSILMTIAIPYTAITVTTYLGITMFDPILEILIYISGFVAMSVFIYSLLTVIKSRKSQREHEQFN